MTDEHHLYSPRSFSSSLIFFFLTFCSFNYIPIGRWLNPKQGEPKRPISLCIRYFNGGLREKKIGYH